MAAYFEKREIENIKKVSRAASSVIKLSVPIDAERAKKVAAEIIKIL